ncbi:MAG: biotin transporter BioY [Elusimicrobia bacterium]|nr:biotin transporter BioY [Elusimicrobiota bacterium]
MTSQAATIPTFFEAMLPEQSRTVYFVEAVCLSLLIGLLAQIQIVLPFTPVPITGQTLGVLYSGALLGSRWGTLSVAMYVMEGCMGLPVFAGGFAGAAVLLGPTGGYILGFIPAAWCVGRLAERGWGRTPFSAATMMLLGSAVIFAFGLAGLARFVPAGKLLSFGLFPFITGDLFKSCLSAAALPAGWKLLGRRARRK